MSVRKRCWINANGLQTRYLVDYTDQGGTRRTRQFKLKREADTFAATTKVEVSQGIHVPDTATVTVANAAENWIKTGEAAMLERTTIAQRRQHIERHIVPFIGSLKLSRLNVPTVRAFQDKLRADGRSPAMIKKVTTSLSGILTEAQERGLVARNPVSELRAKRANGDTRRKRLQPGRDIPLPGEVQRLLAALTVVKWRACIMAAVFTGIRSSELRGLRWNDIDLQNCVLHVRQRADRYNTIGRPKTTAGTRSIPVPPILCNVLREWRLACPSGTLGLVFPNRRGGIASHTSIIHNGLWPAMLAAGLCDPVTTDGKPIVDTEGKPVMKARYSGLHSPRHWYASWLINRKVDGGLELPPKTVQERLGHSSITMTYDTYSHLFPSRDDDGQLAAAALHLVG